MYYQTDEEIKRTYIPHLLEYSLESGEREILRIGEYMSKLNKQRAIIKNMEFRKIVSLWKNPWTQRGEYSVVLRHIPQVEGGKDMCYETSHQKVFRGSAKAAIEYAEALAKEYEAELVREGM